MARRMEKRSARILALLLAFIMIGSVFAYMMKGGSPKNREVKVRVEDFEGYLNWTPRDAYYIQYFNLTYITHFEKNDPLRQYVDDNLQKILTSAVFSRSVLEMTSGISKIYVANYMTAIPLYFIDANMGKVYFAKDDEVKYGSFTMQVRKGGIALVDETSPIIVGYKPLVEKTIDIVEGKEVGLGNLSKYVYRINGSFAYAFIMYGKAAGRILKSENESICDFFFEGYRYNQLNNTYEKVWAIHFIGNYFFSGMNETMRDFKYYKVRNFDDGFGIAIMEDEDFIKVVNAQPRILTWKIINEENENESS